MSRHMHLKLTKAHFKWTKYILNKTINTGQMWHNKRFSRSIFITATVSNAHGGQFEYLPQYNERSEVQVNSFVCSFYYITL